MADRGDGRSHRLRSFYVNMLKRYGLRQLNMLERNHHEGYLRHRRGRGEQLLAATAQSAETIEPCDGALDHPAALQVNCNVSHIINALKERILPPARISWALSNPSLGHNATALLPPAASKITTRYATSA